MNKKCSKCKGIFPLDRFYNCKIGGKYKVRSLCKDCFNQKANNYRRSKDGRITQIYGSQRANSRLRGHPYPNYSKDQLAEWIYLNPLFDSLYDNWVNSGFNRLLSPSCDRKSSLKPYTLDNLTLGTFAENHKNENYEIKNGIIGRAIPIIGMNIKTNESVSFISASEAQRQLNIAKTHISACCVGARKSAGGYKWKIAI